LPKAAQNKFKSARRRKEAMRASLTDNNAVRFGFGQAEFGSYLCTVPKVFFGSFYGLRQLLPDQSQVKVKGYNV
ncbi:MAG: hypothetical protein IIY55_07705, partial [Blautia sp.]|nr:hypothetical protein [Blautia sp.]